MKIECILKRLGGSFVEIDGITYHFAPDAEGRHVANVKNKLHAKRFLAIPEGYEPVVDDVEEDEPAPAPVQTVDALNRAPSLDGSPLTRARLALQDSEGVRNDALAAQEMAVASNEARQNGVEAAAVRTSVDDTQDNLGAAGKIEPVAQDSDAMEGVGDSAAARNDIVNQPDPEAVKAQELAELRATYEERTGKKPHPRLSAEKLREAIAAE